MAKRTPVDSGANLPAPLTKLPAKTTKNTSQLSLDLFALDSKLDGGYSNLFQTYDLMGKFLYGKSSKYLKEASADETNFTRKANIDGLTVEVSVTAANIERVDADGKKKRVFVFPGAREEIVEAVLRKFATERRAEIFESSVNGSQPASFVGVKFSLYEVYKELKRIGKSYSYAEIREALFVMNKAGLAFKSEDGAINLSAPFFPLLAIADRHNPEETQSLVCFHPMVTNSILTLNYKRYNYETPWTFKGHYTRPVYNRLCLRWRQADHDHPYTIKLTTLVESLKTPYKNLYQEKELLCGVMDDLVAADVLSRYECHPRKVGKQIIDWLFSLYPTEEFAHQMASNNKVENRIRGRLRSPEDVDDTDIFSAAD